MSVSINAERIGSIEAGKSASTEKLCLFCPHFYKTNAEFGSEWTGQYGYDGFACSKGHYDEYGDGSVKNEEEMRALFLRANTCPDYENYKGEKS
jgi:hypothetical protein